MPGVMAGEGCWAEVDEGRFVPDAAGVADVAAVLIPDVCVITGVINGDGTGLPAGSVTVEEPDVSELLCVDVP